MKFFLLFLLFSFTLLSSGFSKILNIENKIQIEVPASHKFIKYDNEEVKNSIEEFVQDYEGMEIDLYLVGPKKYVDLEQAILDGEDPMNNEYVRSIMNKFKKKNFKDEVRAGKWMVSEVKKIMKKEKIDFITYALVSNQSWIKISAVEGDELGDMINEIQNMDNQELKEATKEIRKEITKLSGNNKSIPINESTTINLSKFEIAKNENDELFLKSNGKLIMIFGAIKLDVMLNVFIAEHKSKTYAFISACYVDCSKFNSKFNNMIEPVFSTTKKIIKTKTTNSSNGDLIKQLEQLNSLFKSGVLTKEEFEKAKKKILN